MAKTALTTVSPPLETHATDGRLHSTVRLWLLPPFTVVIFLLHLVVVWRLRATSILEDPGTGWHLVTGRYIIQTLSIPTHDLFSFTAAGKEWITDYWLFETLSAALERLGGLPLYAAVCALIYGAIPVLLLRRMLRMGTGLAPAVVLTLMTYVVLMSHALARPHIVTYLLFGILLEHLDRVQRGELTARSLWWVPPVTIAWCNMHGGFLAGLTLVAIFAGVATLQAVVFRDREERRRALIFGGLLGMMALATLCNPVGPRLHLSILDQINPKSAGYFTEWVSPNFLQGGVSVRVFEQILLLLVLLLARPQRRLSWVECAVLVFFLDQALHSVRHMNLFVLVAAPIVARELSAIADGVLPGIQARIARITVQHRALRSHLLYFPIIAIGFAGLAIAGATPFPTTFDDLQLSKGAGEFIAAHKDRFERMFNTDNMGGPLIYKFWPDLKVFVDDRFFVYGDDFVIDKYLKVFFAERGWEDVLREYDVTAAVVTSKTACDTLFRASRDWKLAYDDDKTSIFFRNDAAAHPPDAPT
jgi:hypothetical protein